MVEFGKTLNDVVKSDWRCHAVAYMELKRALADSHTTKSASNTNTNNGIIDSKCGIKGINGQQTNNNNDNEDNEDVHSVHTESSYCISDNQKANFFRIYEDSIRRLTSFYENRVQWANEERGLLEKGVMGKLAKDEGGLVGGGEGKDSESSSTSFLIHRINNFSRDLGLVLEFLELNATAFSKIMKKFDKRTGSDLREIKLKKIKVEHPYLYDGGELKKCKTLCAKWVKELQVLLRQDSDMVVGHLERQLQSSDHGSSGGVSSTKVTERKKNHKRNVSLTLNNSMLLKASDIVDVGTDTCENPQESSKVPPHKTTDSEADTAKNKVGAKEQPSVRFDRRSKAPRSIVKTKDAQILLRMMDRVNEELCMQKADSPFFDKALELNENSPPSFMSSEVELADVLGQGEFCKIYEVSSFRVPESCHICFLHRGGLDFSVTVKESTPKKIHRKIPSTVAMPDIANDNGVIICPPTNEEVETPPGVTNPKVSTFSFKYDSNISDYDEMESDHEDDEYEYSTRGFMKDHCLRNGESRYAIKRIRSSLVGEEEITDAAIDLAREAEFLASLNHPNIIRIRGTINTPGHPKYSLILDRLYDTLDIQMKKWKLELKHYKGKFKGLIGKDKRMVDKMWMDRLVCAYDLTRAMAYLHHRGVLHRDIKPQNIGFDIRGDIKIFDFGLGKELKPCEKEGHDQYHTSGLAGTRRYMAPEVAQIMPYGFSSDVYSFGILVWEMLSLKEAFEKYSREKHYKEVIVEGKRPKIPRSWDFVVKNLLGRCWHKVPSERPTFQAVCELIKMALPAESTVDVSGRSDDLMLRSYRSTGHLDRTSSHHKDQGLLEHMAEAENTMKSNKSSDSLSQSIRIKSPHVQVKKKIEAN